MCGRYRLKNAAALKEECRRLFGITFDELAPRYNVAPSQVLPVLALDKDDRPRAAAMRWGFVPFWEKSEKPKFAPINARSEEAFGKPMFRQAIQKRRCLIPADGFYEWKRVSETSKQPFDIRLKDERPFFFAGIYENATGIRPETCLLFTTTPNELMEKIHNRMPVILTDDHAKAWLQSGAVSAEAFSEIVVPFPAEKMAANPVSTLVNNPRNTGPECMAPLDQQ